MAEPVSLLLGILPLVNTLIEDFRYIRVARDCESNFGTYQIRLSYAENQLTRLERALTEAREEHWTDTELKTGQDALLQLQSLYEVGRRKSVEYGCGDDGFAKGDLAGAKTEDDWRLQGLSRKLGRMSLKRKSGPTVWNKAKWALADKAFCEENMGQIDNLLRILTDTFSGTGFDYLSSAHKKFVEVQQKLMREELAEWGTEATQEILEQLAKENTSRDEKLEEVLKNCKEQRGSVTVGRDINGLVSHGDINGGTNMFGFCRGQGGS